MRLRRERRRAGLTQVDLAKLSGVAQSTISKLERDDMPRVSFAVLNDLARALRRSRRPVEAADLLPAPAVHGNRKRRVQPDKFDLLTWMTGPIKRPWNITPTIEKGKAMPDLATQTYLTVSEAQEYLRLPSKWAVYHWAASTPGLRKYRVGRTIRFKRIEIDRCLAGEVAPGLAIVRK